MPGTIGNPSFSLATPNYKHEGALSEEAVCKMKNYTGTCSADPRHLLMELQSLFSEGSIEKIDPHDDLAFPSAERGRNEPVDTLVCSEPDTNQGICKDLSRAEEKESCMSISVQHYESGGIVLFIYNQLLILFESILLCNVMLSNPHIEKTDDTVLLRVLEVEPHERLGNVSPD